MTSCTHMHVHMLSALLLLLAVLDGHCFVPSSTVARPLAPVPVLRRPALLTDASAAAPAAMPLPPPHEPPEPTVREWLPTALRSKAIAPAVVLLLMHAALRRLLRQVGVTFPASIVGMLGGFGVLCGVRRVSEGAASTASAFFEPACVLFRTWLACIFAPGFIALPLKVPPLGAVEVVAFFGLLLAGFATSTATNAAVATALAPRNCDDDGCATTAAPAAAAPAARPFPRAQQQVLAAVALGALALYLGGGGASAWVLNLGLLAATLGSFSLASTLCPPRVQLWVHPFVSCSAAVLLACAGIGRLSGFGWRATLGAYAAAGGAGGWLTQLAGPTVVSFSLQLYRFRAQLLERWLQLLGTATLGSLTGMLSAAAAARALGLPPALRLALLSRSTTTALAPEMCRLLSCEPSISPYLPYLPASQVSPPLPALGMLAAFLTGLVAIPLGKPLLSRLGVRDPAARGLALSGTAHGGAVLCLSDEREAFPFAALMMSLGAACSVGLLTVAPVRALVLRVALGQAV
uniref:Plastidal glycolate/glycerate translocator 1, chloroplastic n=1 Tax=Emiliania huxleyi TaxID=2903 RepID=A0A7S3TSV0_EMIHU